MYILCLALLTTGLEWGETGYAMVTKVEASSSAMKPSLAYVLKHHLNPPLSPLKIVMQLESTAADVYWFPLATQPCLPTADVVTDKLGQSLLLPVAASAAGDYYLAQSSNHGPRAICDDLAVVFCYQLLFL
jgi:hypothetical protein